MHKYFTASDWGINWPANASAPLASPPPPVPSDHGFLAAAAPVGVLFAIGLTIVAIAFYGGMIGELACSWRLSYSPSGTAFSIWGVIFVWSIGSCVYQLLNGFDEVFTYTSRPWVNLLEMGAWLLSAVWVLAFSSERGRDPRRAVTTAMFFLVAAMLCAVGAAVTENSWRNDHVGRILGVGVPYSLLAGWLWVASGVSVGIVIKAWTTLPNPMCRTERRVYTTLLRADPVEWSGWESWAPLLLATGISAIAFLLPDPILPLPVLWAIRNMKGHFKNWLAIELLVVTVIAAIVEVSLGLGV